MCDVHRIFHRILLKCRAVSQSRAVNAPSPWSVVCRVSLPPSIDDRRDASRARGPADCRGDGLRPGGRGGAPRDDDIACALRWPGTSIRPNDPMAPLVYALRAASYSSFCTSTVRSVQTSIPFRTLHAFVHGCMVAAGAELPVMIRHISSVNDPIRAFDCAAMSAMCVVVQSSREWPEVRSTWLSPSGVYALV